MHESCATSRPAIALPAGAAHPRGISPSTVKFTRIRFASVHVPHNHHPFGRRPKKMAACFCTPLIHVSGRSLGTAPQKTNRRVSLNSACQDNVPPTPKLQNSVTRFRGAAACFLTKFSKMSPFLAEPWRRRGRKHLPFKEKLHYAPFLLRKKAPSTATMQSFIPPPPTPREEGRKKDIGGLPGLTGWGVGYTMNVLREKKQHNTMEHPNATGPNTGYRGWLVPMSGADVCSPQPFLPGF